MDKPSFFEVPSANTLGGRTFDTSMQSTSLVCVVSEDQHYILKHSGSHGDRFNAVSEVPFEMYKVSADVSYVELSVLSLIPEACLGFGVGPQSTSRNHFPGWDEGSVGLHSDDGSLQYKGSAAIQSHPLTGPFGVGDIVGCGVLWQSESAGFVFFTLNGSILGKCSMPIDHSAHLVIALDGPGSVSLTPASSSHPDIAFAYHNLDSVASDLAAVGQPKQLVTALDADSLETFLTADPSTPSLIEFYSPVCASDLANMYRRQLRVGAINALQYPELAAKYVGDSLSGLRLFSNGEMTDAVIPSDKQAAAQYLKQVFSQLIVSINTREEFVGCLQSCPIVVMGYFSEEGEMATAFRAAAQSFAGDMEQLRTMFAVTYRRRVTFATIGTEDIASSLGITAAPAVLLVKDGGKEIQIYQSGPLNAWVSANARSWVCSLNSQSIKLIPEHLDRTSVVLFTREDCATACESQLVKDLRELAASAEFRDGFQFFVCDSSNPAALDLRKRFGLDTQAGPELGAVAKAKHKYVPSHWGDRREVTPEEIGEFARDVAAGRVAEYARSAPACVLDGALAVQPVSASQYSLVSGSVGAGKQALLLFFASGDQPGSLARDLLRQIAALEEPAKQCQFFEIDLAVNDPPPESGVESSPVFLRISESGEKHRFEGQRTLQKIVEFMGWHE